MEHSVITDFSRLFLTIGWGWAAWVMFRAARQAKPGVAVIRYYAVVIAMAHALLPFAVNWFAHSEWDLSWINETSRTLSYLTAALVLVWAYRSLDQKDGPCR